MNLLLKTEFFIDFHGNPEYLRNPVWNKMTFISIIDDTLRLLDAWIEGQKAVHEPYPPHLIRRNSIPGSIGTRNSDET